MPQTVLVMLAARRASSHPANNSSRQAASVFAPFPWRAPTPSARQ
ncbi:MAG: hypothetical protein AAGB12_16810 [Pseudomonadota bacterium]